MNLGEYALPIAILLCGFILLAESVRNQKRFQIDLLFGVSIIYAICFGIVPIFIFSVDLTYYSDMHWIRRIPLNDTGYLLASITSFFGYAAIITGYYTAKKVRITKKSQTQTAKDSKEKSETSSFFPEKKVAVIAMFLFILGTLSLLIYVNSIGGIKTALETATLYRSGRGPVSSRWLFLKNLAPVVMIASYIFYVLMYEKRKKRKYYTMMFGLSFVISLYLLMLLSGRLSMVRYIVIFPLFGVLYKNRGQGKFIIFSTVVALAIIIFGNPLFRAFSNPNQFFYYLQSWEINIGEISRLVLMEFSFPYINLVNLLTVGREVSFRFFSDIFIGTATLLPQSLLGIQLPDTLSRVNTNYFGTFGTIPVDLLSFGYYSLSLPGVIIVTFTFGVIIRIFDSIFPPQKTALESILRAAWIVFLSFRVMYGDISLVMQGGFELFVGTILIVMIRKKYQEKNILNA
ncbi:O-antigen polymerase [Dethiobacter alkaliphilus]|uniref:Oligosaccharide repeat unit polymerase n=1 Tax=Dethiobacter alkaliphilus AHT 1 TaxID=555088 RepID=C0GGQ1_DETAL|nr:O-antigen polymerase [Dethiobacter alkaliphilus]EEG77492.1 hypothetical protein DealDRAFT_1615 [Dethiobacter alkaliphilus AHT 1]